MLISKKCQYALRAVFELALREPHRPVKVEEIAAAQNVPPRFLEVILSQLRHARFVASRRGNNGGYMLARAPGELTVGEIIRHLHGPISMALDADARADRSESFYGDHAFEVLWQKVDNAISGVCDRTTFAELIKYERAKKTHSPPGYSI